MGRGTAAETGPGDDQKKDFRTREGKETRTRTAAAMKSNAQKRCCIAGTVKKQ
jgi:hypothetical protein